MPAAPPDYEGAPSSAAESADLAPPDNVWVPAPASSHLLEFAYADRRTAAKGTGDYLAAKYRAPGFLRVRFRATKTSGETEYHYLFDDPAAGAAVFEALCNAAEPGKVVYQMLVRAGVRYERAAG